MQKFTYTIFWYNYPKYVLKLHGRIDQPNGIYMFPVTFKYTLTYNVFGWYFLATAGSQ